MTLYQYSGSGSLIESSISDTTKSFNYNNSSVYLYVTEDYGNITNFVQEINDYEGLSIASESEDNGPIAGFGSTETLYPFGNISLSGSAITQSNYRNYISGSAITKVSSNYQTFGESFLIFTNHLEKILYSYNLSSVKVFSSEDYGEISLIANSSEDYGILLETPGGGEDDYEFISGIAAAETIYPFGQVTLSGSAITQPNYRLYVSGGSEYKLIKNYLTTGTLFSFGEKLESVTYDYNEQSIIPYDIFDYGLVSQSTSESNSDSGLIIDQADSNIDYGSLVGFGATETLYPFGSITLSGSLVEKETDSYSGSGTILINGELLPPNVDFTPSLNVKGTINLSGSSEDSSSNSYISSGSLFSFGEKVERITYSYNQSSSITVDIENYGEISLLHSDSADYGDLISPIDSGTENYGLVGTWQPAGETTLPFGEIQISGNSVVSFDRGTYFGSGVLSIFGTSEEKYSRIALNNTQLFQIFGSALLSEVSPYIGIGTLFSFGEKLERITYDYNQDSIVFYDIFDYGSISQSTSEPNTDSGLIVDQADSNIDYGTLVGFGATETLYPFGSLFISGSLVERETDSYSGSGTIFLSDQSFNSEIDSYSGSGTIFISGTAVEKDGDSYVGLGTLTLSTSAFESEVELYTGSGTLTLSGIATERSTFNPLENSQLFTISGTAVEVDVDSYVGVGTIFISGELVHPNIDYTPHYGIEKNIGIGTTGIQLSGSGLDAYSAQTPENTQLFEISGIATERITFNPPENNQLFQISGGYVDLKATNSYVGTGGTVKLSSGLVEKDVDSYVGTGTIFYVSGEPLYSKVGFYRGIGIATFSGSALESESESYVGLGTAFIDVSSRNYSPIYPRNALPADASSGIGTIRINDDSELTITRAVLPYFAKGGIVLSNTGNESFTRTNYNGSGLITLSGVSSTREIAVYTDVGFGTITLSAASVLRDTESYQSSGIIYLGKHEVTTQALNDSSLTFDNNTVRFNNNTSQFVYSEARTTETDAYRGTGRINILSGSAESFVLQSAETTQLFQISGSAADAYSAQTPETEVLYQFSGNITESRTYGYEGSGQATFGSAAIPIFEPRVFGTGLIRFATYLSDNLYDTCDSEDVTSDNQISAFVKFVSNPPENTILYNFEGSASTSEIQVYTYFGFGSVGISGSHIIRKTKSVVGIGNLSITSTAVKKDIDSYIGSGSIAVLSGSSESRVSTNPQSTVLFSISGISSTRTFKVKTYSGVGTAYFSGSASTRVLSSRSYSGLGTVYLSGELVHPNIKFIPVVGGVGGIGINGSGLGKIGYKYLPVPQTLYVFSGGFESFSESTYVGIGTIYTQPTSSSTINNPYQPPRVYVTII